jgi:hypothetical protein
LLSFTPIAAAMVALVVAPAIHAADVSNVLADRFSIGGTGPPAVAAPLFTLLDPAWLLPPIESLDTATAVSGSAGRADQILHDDAAVSESAQSPPSPGGPLAYSLSRDLTAEVGYHHSELFDRANSETLRADGSTTFSNRPDRDVLDLNMAWHLAGSTVGLGYQLQSARTGSAGDIGISRFLPGNQQATHSFTLGLTRQWGGNVPPPALIEPLLLVVPEPDIAAAAETTPTPPP